MGGCNLATSVDNILNEIQETFALFDDPLDRFTQLIDMGKSSQGLGDEFKIGPNMIKSCTSKAWMVISCLDSSLYSIKTDSESHIVKGLLSILEKIVQDSTANDIMKLDGVEILNSIGLGKRITSQRTNGFIGAIEMLKRRIV